MVTPALPAGLRDWQEPLRVRAINDCIPNASGRYVLCWLQRALRARDNPVIDASVRLGNALGLPAAAARPAPRVLIPAEVPVDPYLNGEVTV